jgi:hypothetical protein
LSLDLESLRRQYPEMPGWGERVFLELHAIRSSLEDQRNWFTKVVLVIAAGVTGALPALKAGGLI